MVMETGTEVPPGVIDRVVRKHQYNENALIAILQDVQEDLNWLPKPALRQVSEALSIPLSRVWAIASFYKAFSLKPRGKYIVQCCIGTACHVRGSSKIQSALKNVLGVGEGETTKDMKYTLEMVRCLGCCSLAPVMMIGDDFYGQLEPTDVVKKIREYE